VQAEDHEVDSNVEENEENEAQRSVRKWLKIRAEITVVNKKVERRERAREAKAEKAAKPEIVIEEELLERLKLGTYGNIYNIKQKQFENAIEGLENVEEESESEDLEELVNLHFLIFSLKKI
jgi:protein MAK16